MIEIKIKTSTQNKTLKHLNYLNIKIYKITYGQNYIIIKTNDNSLNIIKKFYKYEIIKKYGYKKIMNEIKTNKIQLLYFIFILITIIIMLNINIKIDVRTENNELKRKIINDLYKLDIKPYKVSKNNNELYEIKKIILKQNKERVEWLNIEKIGMTYVINIEQKITKEERKEPTYCNVVASKDGIISRIYPKKGIIIKDVNEYVKKGEIIISGDIKYNDILKSSTCAKGNIFAKIWYKINISIPKTYQINEKTNKKRNNIEIKYNNKIKKIFKSRVKNPIPTKKHIVNIFNLEIYLLKETEGKTLTKEYTKEELNNVIDKLIKEKMQNQTNGKLKIISQKVLKKEENNSTIEEELFIVTEEEIGLTR